MVGVKTDSGTYQIVEGGRDVRAQHARQGPEGRWPSPSSGRPTSSDGKISGQPFHKGTTGAPILSEAPGAVECRVTSIVEQGDHHIVVGEVIEAHLHKPPRGRPDAAILEMKDLGDNVFYGG